MFFWWNSFKSSASASEKPSRFLLSLFHLILVNSFCCCIEHFLDHHFFLIYLWVYFRFYFERSSCFISPPVFSFVCLCSASICLLLLNFRVPGWSLCQCQYISGVTFRGHLSVMTGSVFTFKIFGVTFIFLCSWMKLPKSCWITRYLNELFG